MSARLYRLLEMHQRIDAHLRALRKAPAADTLELTRLKKMKLLVKDLIHRTAPTPALG